MKNCRRGRKKIAKNGESFLKKQQKKLIKMSEICLKTGPQARHFLTGRKKMKKKFQNRWAKNFKKKKQEKCFKKRTKISTKMKKILKNVPKNQCKTRENDETFNNNKMRTFLAEKKKIWAKKYLKKN